MDEVVYPSLEFIFVHGFASAGLSEQLAALTEYSVMTISSTSQQIARYLLSTKGYFNREMLSSKLADFQQKVETHNLASIRAPAFGSWIMLECTSALVARMLRLIVLTKYNCALLPDRALIGIKKEVIRMPIACNEQRMARLIEALNGAFDHIRSNNQELGS